MFKQFRRVSGLFLAVFFLFSGQVKAVSVQNFFHAASQMGEKNEDNLEIVDVIRVEKNQLQIPFVKNIGQLENDEIIFYANLFSGSFFVTNQDISYAVSQKQKRSFFRETFLDSDGKKIFLNPRGQDMRDIQISDYRGNDPNKWRSNLPSFDGLELGEVWEGVKVNLKARAGNVEKIFTVGVESDPSKIVMKIEGASELEVDAETGELVFENETGKKSLTKPVAFQFGDNGEKMFVDTGYIVVGESEYSFFVGEYDRNRTLTIDPLLASTYLGGSGEETGSYTDFDSSGNVFVVGYGDSNNFPVTTGAYDEITNGGNDVFVAKFNSDLTSLLAATYLGGTLSDWPFDMEVSSSGDVIVTGQTYSANFPTTGGAYDTVLSGTSDTFIVKFNNSLSSLSASTFLGGSSVDYAFGLALDGSGNVIVGGTTSSNNFPTTGGAYDTALGGTDDAFVAKLNSSLTTLSAATYLGGTTDGDRIYSLALDNSGNIFAYGNTEHSSFPATAGAYDETFNGGGRDAFVAKMNEDLTNLSAATFLGGSDWDLIFDEEAGNMLIDSSGNVFVAGTTHSADFPFTAGSFDSSKNSGRDFFISKFNNSLSSLTASTFLGGQYDDEHAKMEFDSDGNIIFAGYSNSDDFPVTVDAIDGTNENYSATIISRLSSNLADLTYSTFLHGSDFDYVYGLAVDDDDNVIVTGETYSSDYPTTVGAFDTSLSGWEDIFVSKMSLPSSATMDHFEISGLASQTAGSSQTITITAKDNSGGNYSGYAGDHSVIISGANLAPDGTHPTCTDKNGSAIDLGETGILTFTNGVATCELFLYKSEDAEIEVSDGTYDTSGSESYDLEVAVSVAAANANISLISATPAPVLMGNTVIITVTVRDQYENRTSVGGHIVTVSISGSNGATPAMNDNGNGTYTTSYIPEIAGEDLISGTLNGVAIENDDDGTSDGIFHLTITDETPGVGSGESCSGNRIRLESRTKDKLNFSTCLSKGKSAESEPVSDEKDRGSGLKKIYIRAGNSGKIDGTLSIKKTEKNLKKYIPIDFSNRKVKVYKNLKIEYSFRNDFVEKVKYHIRISKKWIRENGIREVYFSAKEGGRGELLTLKKRSDTESDEIFEAESSSLSKYLIVFGIPKNDNQIPLIVTERRQTFPSESTPENTSPEPAVSDLPDKGDYREAKKKDFDETKDQTEDLFDGRRFLKSFFTEKENLIRYIRIIGAALPMLPILVELSSPWDAFMVARDSFARLYGIILWRRKRRRKWGIVYDSRRGVPLSLAAVSIYNEDGKIMESKISDKIGVYFFLVKPGKYALEVIKKGYSQIKEEKESAETAHYHGDYLGGKMNIDDPDLVDADIPMKKKEVGWLRIALGKNIVHNLFILFFWAVFCLNILIYYASPGWINFIVICIYATLAVILGFSLGGRRWGLVLDSSGRPQPFSQVFVSERYSGNAVARSVTDEYGRYLFVIGAGDYLVKAENREGSMTGTVEISQSKTKAIGKKIVVS